MVKSKIISLFFVVFFILSVNIVMADITKSGNDAIESDNDADPFNDAEFMELVSVEDTGGYIIEFYTTDPQKINELIERGFIEPLNGEIPSEVSMTTFLSKELLSEDSKTILSEKSEESAS
ncbi:hypothetical protein [Methanolapillus millepedarum]|uniref:Uncharacterized protein n=1 Tax=Methanolapillus millepedarum TaxID=3028296 RepID=A0AA96V458_9EURY|nr:hypothetical protein MsAc7_14220 [Methanosarcinaceae archaeon Ac7]